MDDEFADYLDNAKTDPGFAAAYEDSAHLQRVIDQLVGLRRRRRLSQREVGRRIFMSQPTLSQQIERQTADPRLSDLQRYARAVGARLVVVIDTGEDLPAGNGQLGAAGATGPQMA